MPVNIDGTTGVNTPGLASTAMPTSGGDPVVESGSNSDGVWARWADGTQMCRENILNAGYEDSTHCRVLWTFPAPFINVGSSLGVILRNLTDLSSTAREKSILQDVNNSSVSTTDVTLRVWMQAGLFQPGNNVQLSATAFGFWK